MTDRFIDDIADFNPRAKPTYPSVEATHGLWVEHLASGTAGAVEHYLGDLIKLRLESGGTRTVHRQPGAFVVAGRRCSLVEPTHSPPAETRRTASGSIAAVDASPRVARASRIWVEGRHDAELIEKVWGDDLRGVGVVVEPMHGLDNLPAAVDAFDPSPARRLSILLDHLVAGSKEWHEAERLAQHLGKRGRSVLIAGHPFVDVWAAVKPQVIGADAWPSVPKGQPWKDGVCERLGVDDPAAFWPRLLGNVNAWTDLETPLIQAVEQMIDFVTDVDDDD